MLLQLTPRSTVCLSTRPLATLTASIPLPGNATPSIMIIPWQLRWNAPFALSISLGISLTIRVPAVPASPPLVSPICTLLTLKCTPAWPLTEKLTKKHLFMAQTPPNCTATWRVPAVMPWTPVGEP